MKFLSLLILLFHFLSLAYGQITLAQVTYGQGSFYGYQGILHYEQPITQSNLVQLVLEASRAMTRKYLADGFGGTGSLPGAMAAFTTGDLRTVFLHSSVRASVPGASTSTALFVANPVELSEQVNDVLANCLSPHGRYGNCAEVLVVNQAAMYYHNLRIPWNIAQSTWNKWIAVASSTPEAEPRVPRLIDPCVASVPWQSGCADFLLALGITNCVANAQINSRLNAETLYRNTFELIQTKYIQGQSLQYEAQLWQQWMAAHRGYYGSDPQVWPAQGASNLALRRRDLRVRGHRWEVIKVKVKREKTATPKMLKLAPKKGEAVGGTAKKKANPKLKEQAGAEATVKGSKTPGNAAGATGDTDKLPPGVKPVPIPKLPASTKEQLALVFEAGQCKAGAGKNTLWLSKDCPPGQRQKGKKQGNHWVGETTISGNKVLPVCETDPKPCPPGQKLVSGKCADDKTAKTRCPPGQIPQTKIDKVKGLIVVMKMNASKKTEEPVCIKAPFLCPQGQQFMWEKKGGKYQLKKNKNPATNKMEPVCVPIEGKATGGTAGKTTKKQPATGKTGKGSAAAKKDQTAGTGNTVAKKKIARRRK